MSTAVTHPLPATDKSRNMLSLSLMMFLQYAVWGMWMPTLANYLKATPAEGGLGFTIGQVGWIMGLAGSIGAVSAPFLAGQIADRFMNAERYLGILLIVGGFINFGLGVVHDFYTFLGLSILYSIVYMPTLALTNSVAFANLANSEKQFPRVRVWGTVGWIVASNAFPLIWLQTGLHLTALPPFLEGTMKPDATALLADSLKVSGALSILYGIFSITCLPKTPPSHNADSPLAFARAFALLKHRGFLVATLVALPIAMIHQAYFFRTGLFLTSLGFQTKYVAPIMSIGQVSEIVFLSLVGLVIARAGYKWTLVLGCLAYFARFAFFALATEETRQLVVVANALHGLCYGFFFAGAYIYVEKVAGPDIRHSAQTVFGIIILGLGPVLAGLYNQYVDSLWPAATPAAQTSHFWWIQGLIGLFSMVVILLAFPSREPAPPAEALETPKEQPAAMPDA
jgi:nucleoside transporter